MKTDFKRINAAALSSVDAVLNRWLPGGKQNGHEYQVLNPTRTDSKLGSFSINCNNGAWADFASDGKGGDLVALVAYLDGIPQGEAAKRLAEFLGLAVEKTDPAKRATSDPKRAGNTIAPTPTPTPTNKPAWRVLLPVPDGTPPPYATHSKHGKPSLRWKYHDAAGQLLCWVYRFEPKDEGERKQFMPLTYCEDATGKRVWRWQGLPDPRPLYCLDKLHSNIDAPVIVAEGEKAADAAALLFPDAVCTTMLNGAQSPHKSDWRPLAGRVVWLWPDNDEAGRECMAKVAKLAKEAGAKSVEMFNLAAFACAPGVGMDDAPCLSGARPLPEKWDAADAVAAGWTAGHVDLLMQLPDFLQPASVETSAPVADAPRNTVPDDASGDKLSRFDCSDRGVWYYDSAADKWWWVCSVLKITAFTRDAKNESWGRLLEFVDMDGTHHAWAMPMEMLKGDGAEYRGILLSMGLQIDASRTARDLLTRYIQKAQVEQRALCVCSTGWHGNKFVMTDRTIGENEEDEERILFQSASAAPGTFKRKGKLTDWKTNVASLCAGNSRLMFAVSAAFAAPLLHIAGMESGGVHLRGNSSTGKTTGLRVAASAYGGPDYMKRWRTTTNGLEGMAAQHSDCLLPLDEMGEMDPKEVGSASYTLSNGGGKVRADRNGGLRDSASWRILFLSSGETGLSELMAQAKMKPKAGMEIRLLDIPADAGADNGMFENLHSYANGSTFSKALTEATTKYYGTAAQAFIEKLVAHSEKIPGWIKKAQREFADEHVKPDAGGQVHRAALRFALIGAAGEIASKWEITGWQPGEANQAAVTCYKAWLAQRGGAGNLEELNMLAQVRRFFEAHGEARFTDWSRPASDSDGHNARTIQRAGYRKHSPAVDSEDQPIFFDGEMGRERDKHTEYFVFKEVFRQEVCAGFDYRAVCKLLVRHGCLMTEGKSYTRNERLPGGEGKAHVFRITHKLFEGDSDE